MKRHVPQLTLIAVLMASGVFAAGLTPQSYVQDGLVAQFDAIDNEGTGVHNGSATAWSDLVGSASATLAGTEWTDRYLSLDKSVTLSSMPGFDRQSFTLELPCRIIGRNGQGAVIVETPTGGFGVSYHYTSDKYAMMALPEFSSSTVNKPRVDFTNVNGTYACFSGGSGTKLGVVLDGVLAQRSNSAANSGTMESGDWKLNVGNPTLIGNYYGLRFYSRPLSIKELKRNSEIDRLRFWSYTYSGNGSAVNWEDVAWTAPQGATGSVPTSANDYAQVGHAALSVAADIALAGLSLEDGATISIAADAVATVNTLYVEGVQVRSGFYTGTGDFGMRVSWLSGNGILCVGAARLGALSAYSYVQDGLVAQFDAIDNEGTGVQNGSATVWSDLVGSASVSLSSGYTWNSRDLYLTAQQTIAGMPAYNMTNLTVELAAKMVSRSTGTYVLNAPNGFNIEYQWSRSSTDQNAIFTPAAYTGNSSWKPRFTFTDGTFAAISGRSPTNTSVAVDGILKDTRSTIAKEYEHVAADWKINGNGSATVYTRYRAIRLYARPLTMDEIMVNAAIDNFRFRSFTCAGDGSAVSWGDVAWTAPDGASTSAPASTTNDYAQVSDAAMSVANGIALAGLSLEDGATLQMAENAVAMVRVLFVNGRRIPRGVYFGERRYVKASKADWVSGRGAVCVADTLDGDFPKARPESGFMLFVR